MIINLKENLLILKTVNKKEYIKIGIKKNIFMNQVYILAINKQKFKFNINK